MFEAKVYSVTEVTKHIKSRFEEDELLQTLWIKGEVSNLREYQFGSQLYFTLKDATSQINCVIFSANRLAFQLKDQMSIMAHGKITIFEKRGTYTFQISYAEPAGIGALALAFEQLQQKLQEEGLFDQDFKKSIPLYCSKVGLITSPSGAVLHDVIATIKLRNPSVRIYLLPCVVQGNTAAASISSNIALANTFAKLDVIILARGGGSIEELWGFNEEQVARAIFDSKIPVISAIGHETDFTIADFVADSRAATPTAAAMQVSLSKDETIRYILGIKDKLKQLLMGKLHERKMHLSDLGNGLNQACRSLLQQKKQQLLLLQAQLAALSPHRIIEKGFVLVRRSGALIRSAHTLQPHDEITLSFHDGTINAVILP